MVYVSGLDTSNLMFASDSLTYSFKNKGNTTISGTVFINVAVDTGSGPIFFMNDTIIGVSMMPGDTITDSLTIGYNPGPFKIGTNIVVIWPSAANAVTLDSIFSNVTLTAYTSVLKIDPNKKLTVYPNPTAEFLKLVTEANAGENYIKRIRMFDISGKIVDEYDNNTTLIRMDKYSAGTYMLVVEYTDHTSARHKIIRE